MNLIPDFKEPLNRAAVEQGLDEAAERLMKHAEIVESYVNDYVL